MPWAIALVALAVVGAVIIWLVRRAIASPKDDAAEGFTLQGLRELRDRGEISEEEFERAKEAMIGRIAGSATAAPDQDSPSDEPTAPGKDRHPPELRPNPNDRANTATDTDSRTPD